MSTLPAPHAGSKPARAPSTGKSRSGKKPPRKRDPERANRRSVISTVASSPMMKDAKIIAGAAQELLDRLEAFLSDYHDDSIVRRLRAARLEGNEPHWEHVAKELLYDARGGVYALESFFSFWTSQLVEELKEGR